MPPLMLFRTVLFGAVAGVTSLIVGELVEVVFPDQAWMTYSLWRAAGVLAMMYLLVKEDLR